MASSTTSQSEVSESGASALSEDVSRLSVGDGSKSSMPAPTQARSRLTQHHYSSAQRSVRSSNDSGLHSPSSGSNQSPQRGARGDGSSAGGMNSSSQSATNTSRSTSPTTGSPRDLSPPLLRELATMNCKTLARRPDEGTLGTPIAVKANFFEVSMASKNMLITQYHVDIEHPGSRKVDRDEYLRIFWTCVEAHPDIFTNRHTLAFDGSHQLYVCGKLAIDDDKPSIKLNTSVTLAKDARETTQCALNIQCVGPVLMDISKAARSLEDRIHTPIQIMDIVFRQRLTSNGDDENRQFYPFKSSFYAIPGNGGHATDLGGGKEMWTGFFSSAHVAGGHRALLNIDVSHTVFYKYRQSLLEYMCDVLNEKATGGGPPQQHFNGGRGGPRGGRGGGRGGYQNYGGHQNQMSQPPPPMQQQQQPYAMAYLNAEMRLSAGEARVVADALKGIKIRVQHNNGKARVYRVNTLAAPADQLSFTVRESENGPERRMTVAEYFNDKYGTLRYPRLPCLHVGPPTRNIYFPIEVCFLDAPQKFTRKLNERQTSTVIRAAAVDAIQRQTRIQQLVQQAGYHHDPFLAAFGMQLNPYMVELMGRVLPTPAIQFCPQDERNPQAAMVQPVNGAWETNGQCLYQAATCNSYALIALVPQRDQAQLQNFCAAFHRKASELGLQWPQWPDCVKYGRGKDDIGPLYKDILVEYKRVLHTTCDIVFVIMPTRNADIYSAVKESSDLAHGVMSQCVLWKNVQRPSPATCANLVLKVNMKLGGVNSKCAADDIARKWIIGQPTLVMGIDVTHPTASEERQGIPSVAAITGNMDLLPMAYGANVKVQRKCHESVIYLLDAVRERLVAFYKATGYKPNRIIVYRDGVSDGQFTEVLREEMQGIRTACLMLSPDYRPPITYIVVQKRHHARLFCANQRDSVGKCRNIPPGTTVDTSIVSVNAFDFYLCSHFGIQGTSRPTRYAVLWDDNGFTADELQSVTYMLCHTYGRCARTVSIPAPVYYADLVATRARVHLKHKLDVHDSDSMTSEHQRVHSSSSASAKDNSTITGATSCTTLHAPSTIKPTNVNNRRDEKEEDKRSGGGISSGGDSALHDAVQVVDKFKSRMYFI